MKGCVRLQITYHNLQCIFQHLHLTKGAAAAASAAATTPVSRRLAF